MPPLLADLIHARGCKLKCEKFLTLPLQEALSGVTSCKYLNNAKTPSREITRWRFLTKHVSYVNT